MISFRSVAMALALVAPGVAAQAATVVFSGSRMNVDAPGAPSARCGTLTTASIRNDPPTATSTGTSNFGAFTPTLSHCIQLPLSPNAPTPFSLGEFIFSFESGDTLFGSYSGSVTPVAPGQFSIAQTHTVAGGTGLFAGATGSFDSSGSLSFLTGRPAVQQTFDGNLNVPAVPEPITWIMMIIGFGAIGFSMRNAPRRRVSLA